MAATEKKTKKPPSFHYLPKSRAKRLKKSWIEDHKIRGKWKAQKRREGLTNQTGVSAEDTSSHVCDKTNANTDTGSDTSPGRPDVLSISAPSHDKECLRNLRKIAYTSLPIPTQKAGSSRPGTASRQPRNNRGRETAIRRQTGQPNMKLRMNILLEKIKRDFS